MCTLKRQPILKIMAKYVYGPQMDVAIVASCKEFKAGPANVPPTRPRLHSTQGESGGFRGLRQNLKMGPIISTNT